MTDRLRTLAVQLSGAGIENPLQEARWFMELAASRGLSPAQFAEWIRRRCDGEPFQYIVGTAAFYNIELSVGPGVLVPRPETELLVEQALEFLSHAVPGSRVLDLCTGSGAIALAMAHERRDLDFTGIDLSEKALEWALLNRQRLKISNCRFLAGDLFAPLQTQRQFTMVTANPPYVSSAEYQNLESVVKEYEPRMALEAAENGLAMEYQIIAQAPQYLQPGGCLLLEIGNTQGGEVRDRLIAHGYQSVRILPDLSGQDRIALGCLPHA